MRWRHLLDFTSFLDEEGVRGDEGEAFAALLGWLAVVVPGVVKLASSALTTK